MENETYTLEEIAQKLCDSYEECGENCPAVQYCRKGRNGMIKWLQEVVENGK